LAQAKARDYLMAGADFNLPWEYVAADFENPWTVPLIDARPAYVYVESTIDINSSGNQSLNGTNTTALAELAEAQGRRRLSGWDAVRQLQSLLHTDPRRRRLQGNMHQGTNDSVWRDWRHGTEYGHRMTDTNVELVAELSSSTTYEYVTEVGGICEKLSFASNTSAPGAAVLVRYEEDRHYPVDKVVGAGAADNVHNSQGCSKDDCPVGDQSDTIHNKQRCPAGTVVTGVVSRSGDWVDSIEYVCSPLILITEALLQAQAAAEALLVAEEARLATELAAAAQEELTDNL
jgi:hypothetical protein